ncbi:hypothetical protein BC827DRAFT_1153907 [Russula dissimulans]|nr:hypothetical protein BC827DRAFT_1153907 [Russula dissimulans]
MSLQLPLTSSGCEARCPACGVTLSRHADVKRHLTNKHPDGTESISNGLQHSCPDCGQRFTDAAAKLRHRKKTHGYQPHHTKEYLARKPLKGKERAVRGPGKEVSNTSQSQPAAGDDSNGLPNVPSLRAQPRDILRIAYRNDYWKTLVDLARRSASEREISISHGVVTGYDSPVGIQPSPEGSIHPTAQSYTPISSSDSTIHDFYHLVPVPDVMPPQGQALTWPSTSGEGFPNQFSNPPIHSYGDDPQFIPTFYQPALPLWQVPDLTVTPLPAMSTPFPQPDLFIPGRDIDFDSWFQSNV